jgi:hypothetical protein
VTGRPHGGIFLVVGGERYELDLDLDTLLRAIEPARRARLRQLERQAVHFRVSFPDATANDFHRLVKGRRADALAAFRNASESKPTPGAGEARGDAPTRFPFANPSGEEGGA